MNAELKNYISNHDELLSNGNVSLRRTAIDIIEHGLTNADPYSAVIRLLKLEGEVLQINDLVLNLGDYERIFILGAGKASLGIALALENILGDRITDGLFVLKYGSHEGLHKTQIVLADHPYPDENSHTGALKIMDLASTLTEKDIVFAGITGGSSALLALPTNGITFEEIKQVNQTLILSGADIVSINTIRKHLSKIKGGWLAEQILPATLINLTVSDVVGDMLDYITGPTVPDTSTFSDARRVMDSYDLWDKFPESASEYIRQGSENNETPKDFLGLPLYSFVIVPGDAACVGAYKRAVDLGFNTMILTSMLTGEASSAGMLFASIAKEVSMFQRPLNTPCAILAGGENVVTIRDDHHGSGGPNHEFSLSASIEISNQENILIASLDTDGLDGSTEYAGVVVDGSTHDRVIEKNFNPQSALQEHDTEALFSMIGDSIKTGLTGTNVNDLKVALIE